MGNSSSSAGGAQNPSKEEVMHDQSSYANQHNNGMIMTQSHNIGGSYNNDITYIAAAKEVKITQAEQRPAELPKAPDEEELKDLIKTLWSIKGALYDVDQKKMTDLEKDRLRKIKKFAIHAEDVLDDYHYEVLKAQMERGGPNLAQVPDDMLCEIEKIREKFSEIVKDGWLLLKRSEDERLEKAGGRRKSNDIIFGREREKEELIALLNSNDTGVVSVVSIIGIGGLGKTTLAELVYYDQQIRGSFDKFGKLCVSNEFKVKRLMIRLIESITLRKCDLDENTNIDVVENTLEKEIEGKRLLIVLDDVWNTSSDIWEEFCSALMSASIAKILVTTRNELDYLPKESRLMLGSLQKEPCWQLFEKYAFPNQREREDPNLIKIGEEIIKECGMLPLSVKSIASLLGHKVEERTWSDILRDIKGGEFCKYDEHDPPNKYDASNKIFGPLQISYARLPTCLKPCFLHCSMFPKDFLYNKKLMVKLWISQGYITTKGDKDPEEIGWEYAEQLEQRSLFESVGDFRDGRWTDFKLHDLIHDLAQLNSKNADCSIGVDMTNNLKVCPNELHHLLFVVRSSVSLCESPNLRTLIIRNLSFGDTFDYLDLSMTPKLRALLLGSGPVSLNHRHIFSVGGLKHLRYLALSDLTIEFLPECICSLYHLKRLELCLCSLEVLPKEIGNLINLEIFVISDVDELRKLPESLGQLKALRTIVISECEDLEELPTSFKNLVSLRKVVIEFCHNLTWSPDESLCQLKALRELNIHCNQVGPVPASLQKLASLQTLRVRLECDTIGWLHESIGLVRALSLVLLRDVTNLADVECANLVEMKHLEHLQLSWCDNYKELAYGEDQLLLIVQRDWSRKQCEDHCAVMTRLQPHPKLKELHISGYGSKSFPKWIEDPNSCTSLESVCVVSCNELTSIAFGRLHKLKSLEIRNCDSLKILEAKSLPSELKELYILRCNSLLSMPGIQNLKSLVTLCIESCANLQHLSCATLTAHKTKSSQLNSRLVLRNLTALRKLMIWDCPKLQLPTEELLCQGCETSIWNCFLLTLWCSQHRIEYKNKLDEEWRASYNIRQGARWTNTMSHIHYYESDKASMWRNNQLF